jgi:hypothetical protein
MGRNVESMRQGIEGIIKRWESYGRAMKGEDKKYIRKLIELAKVHSGEAQYALYDPFEAVILSILIEMEREMEEIRNACRD